MQPAITQLNDQLWMIDNRLLGIAGFGATYVLRGDTVALIETGTSLSAEPILAGLERLGVRREAVSHILLTHVHMDHAGGAGALARALPNADVCIHSMSIPHLIDPARLLVSVERAVGPLWPLYGAVEPLPAERLKPAEELRLDLGRGVALEAIPTPGHSPDHLAYWQPGAGALWTGDAAGLVLPAYGVIGPVMPPPGFDLPAQLASFELMRALPVETLMISHFGPAPGQPRAILDQVQEQTGQLSALVEQGLRDGQIPADEIVERLAPLSISDDPAVLLAVRGTMAMNIAGLKRYFEKRAREQAA